MRSNYTMDAEQGAAHIAPPTPDDGLRTALLGPGEKGFEGFGHELTHSAHGSFHESGSLHSSFERFDYHTDNRIVVRRMKYRRVRSQ